MSTHIYKEVKYDQMVKALAKPGADIIQQLTPRTVHQWHMASAICGEAGELFDAIKRCAIYGKPLDMANVIEELGDLEFYMEGLRESLGISREDTLNANIEKLGARYKGLKYTDQAAQDRRDKVNKVEPKVVPAEDFLHMREKATQAAERKDQSVSP